MSDEQKTPLEKWAKEIAIARNRRHIDSRDMITAGLADYAASLEAERAHWPQGDDAALALAKATGESWRLRFPHLTAWEDYSEEMRQTHVALQKDVLRRLAEQQREKAQP